MKNGNTERIAYNIKEASAVSGLSVTHLYKLSHKKKLKFSKVGNRLIILKSELEQFLKDRIKQESEA